MTFANLKNRKRDELPKFFTAPIGTYLFTILGAKEKTAKTNSVGIQVTLRIDEIGSDVDVTGVDVAALQGKKQSTNFWLEDDKGEVLGSAAFATEFLDAVYGEGQWEDMLEAFQGLEGRQVKGKITHRIDASGGGDPKVFADLGGFTSV